MVQPSASRRVEQENLDSFSCITGVARRAPGAASLIGLAANRSATRSISAVGGRQLRPTDDTTFPQSLMMSRPLHANLVPLSRHSGHRTGLNPGSLDRSPRHRMLVARRALRTYPPCENCPSCYFVAATGYCGKTEFIPSFTHPASTRGTLRPIVTKREAGKRWMRSCARRSACDASDEAVWSRHPDAGVNP